MEDRQENSTEETGTRVFDLILKMCRISSGRKEDKENSSWMEYLGQI